jgi:predicted dehydrogenase
MAASRRYRVAIVGAGIGRAHGEGFRALPELFEVALVCDLNLERARELAALTPGAEVTSDFDAVLARPDVDIVDVCVPPFLHLDMVAGALRAGKDVLCEKPLVGSLAEVDALAAIAAETGRRLVPVFQYRHGNGLRKLEHLIRAGVAGRPFVTSIETHWNRTAAYYAVAWRGRRATELGGAVLSHAIHAHDLLTRVHGPVRRVFARTAVRVNAIETEDCAALCFEMADGALATHSLTLGSAEEVSRFRFCFEHLTAESCHTAPYRPAEEPWRFIARGEGEPAERIAAELAHFAPPGPEGFAGLFAAVHEALAAGGPPPVTIEDARGSIELAAAIYHSAATGTDVALPLGDGHPTYRGW